MIKIATINEILEKDFARQIEFNNIKKYHEMGYKGKGIVVLNAESNVDHRIMTSGAAMDYAPEISLLEGYISTRTSGDEVLYCTVNFDSETLDLEEAIDKYNIKIITRSYSGATSKALLNYFKEIQKRKGVIFFNSAGNEPYSNGVWSKYDTALTVSACKLFEDNTIRIIYFGSEGEVDFTCFMAKGTGTSAASPALVAKTALLLQRYGDFNQNEAVEILKSISMKLPNIEDYKQGYGLPILPLTDKLEIIEKMRGDKMDFKDVEQDRWSKEAIDFCVEQGTLQGFPDGTFKPTEPMTREQYARAEYNKAKKEGRI